MRSPTRILAASVLSCEALVVMFAGLVARNLTDLSTGAALGVAGVLALACLLTAGLLRTRVGYVLGSVLQVVIIATGFWVGSMFGIGVLFATLWVLALVLGTRAERAAEARWAAEEG
jgi:hypothetical protein